MWNTNKWINIENILDPSNSNINSIFVFIQIVTSTKATKNR